MKSGTTKKGILVIAHRGGGELFTENTITAFKKAEELGVDAIECDIHLTKDDHIVISHDPDLKRMAGIDRRISEMSFDEISKVSLKGGERIPSIESVFEEVDIPLIVELKSLEMVGRVIRLLEERPDYLKKAVFISFYHKAMLIIKEKFENATTGALLAGFPVDPVSVVKSCKSDTLSIYYEGLSKDYVEMCHRGGIMVSVWTPNSESDIDAVIAAGVDSIASDRPDLVLRALGRT
ncbi:MAG: hypothetical protein M1290_05485 [Candidatus Thermoplasmatota archaeon]|nr:hypothetical protein [Candidatus Thermoplasmatota archaeon]